MQIHCLTYKHTTGLDVLERVAKLHMSGSLCSTFGITRTEGLFGGKTEDYGVTLCDTRVLRVTRGVKQAGRAQTSLLLALRLLLHG